MYTDSDGSSPTDVDSLTVAAGVVWHVQAISMFHSDPVARISQIIVMRGVDDIVLFQNPALPANTTLVGYTGFVLIAGDYLRARVWGLAAAQRAYFFYIGCYANLD
jgi:hypothetical protein